ncbi:PD-(D/E)XK motif protein [Actinoplanes sp. NPDC049681]|uniref:PD-(D/E)XK motif protein n=1 Tax=Actinoplanes sp. NPDC049681 TaxID=3363905 RepID=UPI003797B024
MTDLRSVVQDHWSALDAEPRRTTWLTSELPVRVAGRSLRCAIGPDRHRHLLVPLPPSVEPVRADTRSAAVHLMPLTLEDDGPTRYADLMLLRTDLAEVFTGLCADLLAAMAAEPSDPLPVISEVLNGWRELFRSGIRLGTEQLAGLFGELTVLNALLDLGADLLTGWTGPFRSPQDFRLRDRAIEVKATAAREGRRVGIHGIDQLVIPPGGLILWWMRFDTSDAGGTSVPELVESTVRRLSRPRELWQLLARSGYHAADADQYGQVRFSLAEEAGYRITEEFPRIIPESLVGGLPSGVSDVRYSIDLEVCPAPMQKHELIEFLRTMAAG